MTEARPTVLFREIEIVVAEGGRFSLDISDVARPENVVLVIDIYDLHSPVHPRRHVGWWKYPLTVSDGVVSGRLAMHDGALVAEADGQESIDRWVNEAGVPQTTTWRVNAVLRDRVTNAILAIHRIPAFEGRRDVRAFRDAADQVGEGPSLALAGFAPAPDLTVRIVAPDIFSRDAVGNLCFDVRRLFVENGIAAQLYAENHDLATNDIVRPVRRLSRDIRVDDCLLYFFSTMDPMLPAIVEIKCARKVAYYHGVTRPEALRVFHPELAASCARAIEQIPLLQGFERLAANSSVSAHVLVERFGPDTRWRVEDVATIAPRVFPRSQVVQRDGATPLSGLRMLSVGRIKAHKKIEDALELFAEVLKLDPEAELEIIGGADDKAYRDYLTWVEREHLRLLEGKVRWRGSVSEAELAEAYRRASAYVSMSEDEGYGLPLVEAMMRGVPVVASDIPATREVLGDAGVRLSGRNFPDFARRVVAMLRSDAGWQEMSNRGLARARALVPAMDGRGFLELVAP